MLQLRNNLLLLSSQIQVIFDFPFVSKLNILLEIKIDTLINHFWRCHALTSNYLQTTYNLH